MIRVRSLRRLTLLPLALMVQFLAPSAQASRIRDEVDLLARDVRELERKLLASEQDREALARELSSMREMTGMDQPGHRSPADLAARLDALDNDVRILFENQGETSRRLGLLADKLDALFRRQPPANPNGLGHPGAQTSPAPAPDDLESGEASGAPGTEVAREATSDTPQSEPHQSEPEGLLPDLNPMGSPTGEVPVLLDPEELYQAARADYGRGQYPMAITGFQEFLISFPNSELVDNALYWIGESYYADSDFARARVAFETVVSDHPTGDKVADASLKLGNCLLELNQVADGIIQLQHVKDAYPGTAAARVATRRLQELGLGIR